MNKTPRDINEDDLIELVHVGRVEGPMLEYKGALYDTNDRGCKEFLLDICSMANSLGGYIFIGISEQRDGSEGLGAPAGDVPLGITLTNPEQTLTGYETRILDCIDERLDVESHAIPVKNGLFVLAIRVPNSLSKPHRVSYKGNTYFPARRERQRYDLTATEIKDLVMRTASRLEVAESKVQAALRQDLEKYQAPTLVIAAVPLFTRNFAVDFRRRSIIDAVRRFDLTADGRGAKGEPVPSMAGMMRKGPAEAVTTLAHDGLLRLVVPLPQKRFLTEQGTFYPIVIDLYTRGIARGCGDLYGAAGLSAPVLLGVAIRIPSRCQASYGEYDDPISVESLMEVYPTLTLHNLTDNVDAHIRPLCDLVHQSLHQASSPGFNDDGRWIWSPSNRPSPT
ncbi:MAG TPA: ATP-binding protein [Acidisarcina sp.]